MGYVKHLLNKDSELLRYEFRPPPPPFTGHLLFVFLHTTSRENIENTELAVEKMCSIV